MKFLDILKLVFGSKQERDVKKLKPFLERVNNFGDMARSLDDDGLRLGGGILPFPKYTELMALAIWLQVAHKRPISMRNPAFVYDHKRLIQVVGDELDKI